MTKLSEDNKTILRGLDVAIIHLTQQLLESFDGMPHDVPSTIYATKGRLDSLRDLIDLVVHVAENKNIWELLE